jgi:trigger factor
VAELQAGVRADLEEQNVRNYIYEYLSTMVTVSEVPEKLLLHMDKAMFVYYEQGAASYGMEFEEFLEQYTGYTTYEDLSAAEAANNRTTAVYTLVVQAVAEDLGLVGDDAAVAEFFSTQMGTDDYSSYEETYGLNYLRQAALADVITNYLYDHVELE